MKFAALALASAIALTGCAGTRKILPDNYQGPTAVIKDSTKRYSTQKADLFYLETVDGESIASSLMQTRRENSGKMLFMRVYLVNHDFPIQPTTLGIRGETLYAAPILAMIHPVYKVAGNVQFTPEPGKTYVIKGELSETYSAVWVEEESTQTVVGNKIESGKPSAAGTTAQ